jgi:hypothetical protein
MKGFGRRLWLVGLVGFVVATAFSSDDLFLRVEIGSIVGAGVSAAMMGLFYVLRLHKGIDADSLASLVEQIEYEPIEI